MIDPYFTTLIARKAGTPSVGLDTFTGLCLVMPHERNGRVVQYLLQGNCWSSREYDDTASEIIIQAQSPCTITLILQVQATRVH